MNENVPPDYLVDDTLGLKVDLSVVRYADAFKFRRNMAPFGQIGKSGTERFQLIQYIICVFHAIVQRNVTVDVDQILLCFLGKPDTIAFHPLISLTCLRTSENVFLSGLLWPP